MNQAAIKWGGGKAGGENPKPQLLNPKQYQMTEIPMAKTVQRFGF